MKTPRTDAEVARKVLGQQQTTELVPADFARQLERELAELREAERDKLRFTLARARELWAPGEE